MKSKTVLGLAITFSLAFMLISCSVAPNLNFADRIVVERQDSDTVIATVYILDNNDIKAIVDACKGKTVSYWAKEPHIESMLATIDNSQ